MPPAKKPAAPRKPAARPAAAAKPAARKPAAKPAAKPATPARKPAPAVKLPAALARLTKALETATEQAAALSASVGTDVSVTSRQLYKDLSKGVKDARTNTTKLGRTLEKDLRDLQKAAAAAAKAPAAAKPAARKPAARKPAAKPAARKPAAAKRARQRRPDARAALRPAAAGGLGDATYTWSVQGQEPNLQEMVIYGVSFDMVGKQPIVLLKTVEGNKFLPIWIGHPEAASILMKLQGATTPRPMTHDLLNDLLGELEVRCTQVAVTELRENTFFASITLSMNGRELEIDSRPSDAIALAVRAGALIFAADEVIAESAIEFEHEVEDTDDVVEKFKEFLDQVSPEDFAGE